MAPCIAASLPLGLSLARLDNIVCELVMRQHWSRVLRYRLAPEAHSAGVRSMSACALSQCAAGQEAPGVPMWRIRTWSWLCRRSGATTHGCASQAALIGCTRCRGCSSDVTHSLPRKGARRLLVFLGIRWAGGHAVVCVVCCGCVGILSMSGRYPGLFSLTAETSSRSLPLARVAAIVNRSSQEKSRQST